MHLEQALLWTDDSSGDCGVGVNMLLAVCAVVLGTLFGRGRLYVCVCAHFYVSLQQR
jgi:hypothetical protein